MTIKEGVDISLLHPVLIEILHDADLLWSLVFREDVDGLTVTSGHEGKRGDGVHSLKSLHYIVNSDDGYGKAVDVRTNDVLQWKVPLYVEMLWKVVLLRYTHLTVRIFNESMLMNNSHIHIQLL